MKRKQKFPWLNTILIIVALIGLILLGGMLFTNFKFKTYASKKYGFQIKYPQEWEFKENVNGAAVIFYSPLENQLDFFRDNINIVVQDISSTPMNLEEYSKLAVDQMKLVFEENIKVESLTNTLIDGKIAKKFIFTGKGPQADLKYMSVWMIDGTIVYQLTYLAIESQFNNHLFKILTMMHSFNRGPRPAAQ